MLASVSVGLMLVLKSELRRITSHISGRVV